jgi:type IV pilus assembly protein PilQ
MKKYYFLFLLLFLISISLSVNAEDADVAPGSIEAPEVVIASETAVESVNEPQESVSKKAAPADKVSKEFSGNITLDFSDADIRSVLKIISLKTGVNIVASPDVQGAVSIYLDDVPWEKALDVILSTYGYGYEKRANVISVAPLEKLTEQKRMEQELAQVQPTITEVFQLKYIDALDAKKALEPLISARGRITILEMTGKAGWEFSSGVSATLGKREVKERERQSLSRVLLITDIPPIIDQVRTVLEKVDIKPRQIMIEAKVLEVSRDFLEDIGFEYSTQTVGASDITIDGAHGDEFGVGGQVISSSSGTPLQPSIFDPSATGLTPDTAGMKLVLKKLFGSKFEVLLRALEEDVNSNLLSAPRIMTLDNQEATILIGEKYPIVVSTTSESTTTAQESLEYYQDIGIQLNVVPQIAGEDKINMIIHPSITSYTETVGNNQYPIILVREAETQLLINDGETIVIGGLIKDYKKESDIGVPFLSRIPILGWFFNRSTQDSEKIELLVFITATIIDESGLTESEMSFLEENVSSYEYKENIM